MNALINSNIPLTEYIGPLTSGEIIRLGKHLGWQEKPHRGKGSHRCLVHPGFRPVSVPCHGEGQELDKGLVRKLVNRLCQPLQSIDVDLPERINSQFQTWLANEHTYLENAAKVELERLTTEASAHLKQQEEVQLAQAEKILQQLLAKEAANQAQLCQQLEARLQQEIQAVQAVNRELNTQLQQVSKEKQRLSESYLALGQKSHTLAKSHQHILDLEKTCRQARMDAKQKKRESQVTLVSAIVVAMLVSLTSIPNWLKSSTILSIPVFAGISSKLYPQKS